MYLAGCQGECSPDQPGTNVNANAFTGSKQTQTHTSVTWNSLGTPLSFLVRWPISVCGAAAGNSWFLLRQRPQEQTLCDGARRRASHPEQTGAGGISTGKSLTRTSWLIPCYHHFRANKEINKNKQQSKCNRNLPLMISGNDLCDSDVASRGQASIFFIPPIIIILLLQLLAAPHWSSSLSPPPHQRRAHATLTWRLVAMETGAVAVATSFFFI